MTPVLCLLFSLLCSPLFGFDINAANAVKVIPPKTVRLRPGRATDAVILFKVAAGFHVQANPASNPQLIATTVSVESSHGVMAGKSIYPAPSITQLENMQVQLKTYSGTFRVKIPLELEPGAKRGEFKLSGKVRYQPCNDKICLFPQTVPITIAIKIVK